MSTETLVFLLTCCLSIVHLFLPGVFKMLQNGLMSAMGPRDDMKPVESVYGQRAERTNANFKETLPLALGLLILVQVLQKTSGTSAMGAWIYFGARVVYIPLYVFGVPVARTAIWGLSMAGLFMVAMPLFM